MLEAHVEKRWKLHNRIQDDDTLKVVIDLSTFPSDNIYFGLHIDSGSGLSEEVISKSDRSGMQVELFCQIASHSSTMALEL